MSKFLMDYEERRSIKGASDVMGHSAANARRRVKELAEALGVNGALYHNKGKLTPEGENLADRTAEAVQFLRLLFGDYRQANRRRMPLSVAVPEFVSGRYLAAFGEDLARVIDEIEAEMKSGGGPLVNRYGSDTAKAVRGVEFELMTHHLSGPQLAQARASARYHLILNVAVEGTPGGIPRNSWPLRRAVIARNGDSLCKAGLSSLDALGGRAMFLPPAGSMPGLDVECLARACESLHDVATSAEAWAHVFSRRNALSIAYSAWLDEVTDEEAETVDIEVAGLESQARLELWAPRCPRAGSRAALRLELAAHVFEESLKRVHDRASKADALNGDLKKFTSIAYTSRARSPRWDWLSPRLERLHLSSLGVLKGQVAGGGVSFHLFGRVEEGRTESGDAQYHVLLRAVDETTGATDPTPKEEHFSINCVFTGQDLRDGAIVGVWSGRRSGLGDWTPAVGLVILSHRPLTRSRMNDLRHDFEARFERWDAADLEADLGSTQELTS